jgi:hypothetical protein
VSFLPVATRARPLERAGELWTSSNVIVVSLLLTRPHHAGGGDTLDWLSFASH